MSVVALKSVQEYKTKKQTMHQSCAIITKSQVYITTEFGSIRRLTHSQHSIQDGTY